MCVCVCVCVCVVQLDHNEQVNPCNGLIGSVTLVLLDHQKPGSNGDTFVRNGGHQLTTRSY